MAQAPNTTRVTATIPNETYEQLLFWSNAKGISINQYLADALDHAIAWENQDYPVDTIEMARNAQILDTVCGLTKDVENMRHVFESGMNSLLSCVKGDRYLYEQNQEEQE
jgi:hypothetical protein